MVEQEFPAAQQRPIYVFNDRPNLVRFCRFESGDEFLFLRLGWIPTERAQIRVFDNLFWWAALLSSNLLIS